MNRILRGCSMLAVLAFSLAGAQTPAADPSDRLREVLPADVAERVLARIAAAGALLVLADSAQAGPVEGFNNTALFFEPGCRLVVSGAARNQDDAVRQAHCSAALVTVLELGPLLGDLNRFCPPSPVSLKEGALILINHMDKQKGGLGQPFINVAIAAFSKAWPCKKN